MNILVAEGDPRLRRAISQTLRELGHRVGEAVDGLDVLRCMNRQRPDVLLLDVALPEFDGLACLQAIRRIRRYRGVKVVLLSTGKRLGSPAEQLADGRVPGPVRLVEVLDALELLDGDLPEVSSDGRGNQPGAEVTERVH